VNAVIDFGVPGCVGMSWYFHKWDDVAESRDILHGTQSSDPYARRRNLGQRSARHAVRLRHNPSRSASAVVAELALHAARLVHECFRWWRVSAAAGKHLFVHWAQRCHHWCWWPRWLTAFTLVLRVQLVCWLSTVFLNPVQICGLNRRLACVIYVQLCAYYIFMYVLDIYILPYQPNKIVYRSHHPA